MQTNVILGVDIAKKKFDVCLLIGSKERHKVFHNNQEGFAKLVSWCNRHGVDFFIYVWKQQVVIVKI
uniref:hypothetical protein n=1 Tax=Wolbachia pipientis TaxID=955 RepID=UPI0020B8D3BD|nr:hypothetical protein [Wolbachia pipientis]